MLIVNVNLGFHKLFGIKYMLISSVYSSYLYGSRSPFILFNMYMLLTSFYGVLVVLSTRFRNSREKIYNILICQYDGQEKLKNKGGRF
jgi:hypothetical protein